MNKSFREKVYSITRRIPVGTVATYGQIARLAGNDRAARAVGFFMKMNPFAPEVPCHRVVSADGSLTGYSAKGGLARKHQLLKEEGVVFKNGRIDLSVSRWKTGETENTGPF